MTDQTENPIPSQQDDIKSVLQDTLFQQVQTLLNFTHTDGFTLQIPETDTLILAGPLTRIAEFIQREIATPAASFSSQSQAAQPTGDALELVQRMRARADLESLDKMTRCLFLDAAMMVEYLARTSQATKAQAEPVGYVRDGKEGVWGELEESALDGMNEGDALYAAPVAKESPAVELTVWYGSMPESNGKSNFTAILTRKDAEGLDKFDGFTIARSEYPERVRYEADCVRHLIGELAEEPWITDYDADKHSGYVKPVASVAKEATRDAETTEEANVASAVVAKDGDEFKPGQWWLQELEGISTLAEPTPDQVRAVAVARKFAATVFAQSSHVGKIEAAIMWLNSAPHGDNCFVSDHYEGDPGNRCNCGKDSLLEYLESDTDRSDLATTTSTVSAPTEQAKPWSASEALLYAARVVELYDDATMADDYMIDSKDCAAILTALATMPMFAPSCTEGAQKAPEEVRNQATAEPEQIECWSHDEEDFNARSLDELLSYRDDLKPGDTVWVGEAVHPDPAQLVNGDGIIENIGEAAYDIGGEHAEDYPEVTNEQAKELEALVTDWVKRTCPPTFYTVKNIKPYVLSHEDFPHDTAPVELAEPVALRASSTDQANADTGSAA